ncbi:DUF3068 domain-containing protein [Allosaccharopolyspora coralli]|uniref:DUF3068 domain-containing protein n=1 Tax=Allosaccharopolyspora coralli TaxID=2665642 RepID=A0A5Q3QF98_9PSEU|nr:DUF3068 domain-containing protein [Allosaccharopolyspora coralli]
MFAIAMAVLLPTHVYHSLAKTPLNQNSTTVLDGTAERVLAVEETPEGPEPTIREDVDLTAVAKVQANFSRPEMTEGSDVAVWAQTLRVTDNADDKVVSASKRQVCFDRRTAEGYTGTDENRCAPESTFVAKLQQDPDAPGQKPQEYAEYGGQPGLHFKYPFDTQRKSYEIYDNTIGKPVTSSFEGTDEVNGLPVLKFVQPIPATQFSEQQVAGELVGAGPEPSVDVGRYYTNTITDYVEPTTGLIVKQEQQQRQELRLPGQDEGTVVLDGDLEYSPDTIAAKVAQAEESMGGLKMLSAAPWVLGPVGALLVVAGLLLLPRRNRTTPDREFDAPTHPQHAMSDR